MKFLAIFIPLSALLTLSACGGGGSSATLGSSSAATQQLSVSIASSSIAVASQSQTANTSISSALTSLAGFVSGNASLSSNAAVTTAQSVATQAATAATTALATASTASANLLAASSFMVVGVVNAAGSTICAAAASCTSAEVSTLRYRSAMAAKSAVEASLYAVTKANELKAAIISVEPNLDISTATVSIDIALSSATSAQTSVNSVISVYSAAADTGSAITINPSAGTSGSVASAPSYSGSTQTIVTTYGDATTSTATNAAVSNVITWASNHVTRTTTYYFADGTTNPVVADVAGTAGTPVLTASVYPSDWTTTGVVTAPSTSSVTTTYGDETVTTTQAGTTALPFDQTTLSAQSITDPSAVVASTTTTYNLTWGTPDKSGPGYANLFPNASTRLGFNINYMGVTVSGQGVVGPTLVQPSADVLAAWNAGWTGKGQNTLTIDSYSSIGTCSTSLACHHGVTTMMITDLVAPGASHFGLDWGLTPAKTMAGATLATPTTINTINMSFLVSEPTPYINYLTGVTNIANLSLTGAVLVKSAGNNSGEDTYSYPAGGGYFVKGLVDNTNTVTRLLIVGALDKNGSVVSPATIASYSNYAGATTAASDRFVVANGNSPYADGGVSMNGWTILSGAGTSYAAPVVAGYAAVLMSKFPNLNAINTTSIILDTARTDTIFNYNSAIHGRGEASLSRALAPVGSLR